MTPKHRKALEKYDGNPITLREFAALSGCSYKTVRNTRKTWEERGVIFKNELTSPLTKEDLKSQSVNNISLVKSVVNALSYKIDSSHIFASEDAGVPLSSTLRQCDLEQFLNRFLASSSKIDPRLKVIVYDLLFFKAKRPKTHMKDEERLSIASAFTLVHSLTSTEEQNRTVFHMRRFLKKGKKGSIGLVQSVAGTSKSTCLKTLQSLMEEEGLPVPLVVSSTNKAVKGFQKSSTIAKFLSDFAGIRTYKEDGSDDQNIAKAIQIHATIHPEQKLPYLIVDEFSVVSDTILEALRFTADKLLLVGDPHQLSNNSFRGAQLLSSLTEQFRFHNSKTSLQLDVTKLHLKRDFKAVDDLIEKSSVGSFRGVLLPKAEGSSIEVRTIYTGCFDHLLDTLAPYISFDKQIIAYSNAAVSEINTLLNGGSDIKVGSKVILNKKDYKNPLAIPGTLASVIAIKGTKASCLSEDQSLFDVELEDLDLAFAISSTKAQGSSWKKVLAVLGTANKENHYKDTYSILTRASEELEIIHRESVEDTYTKVLELFKAEEGNRNVTLHQATKAVIDYTTQVQELSIEEVSKTMNNAVGYKSNSSQKVEKTVALKKEVSSEKDVPKSAPTLTGDKRYGLIIDGVHPTTEQTSMTEKQASYRADQLRKNNKEVTIVENLKNGNRVVIDLDSQEAVEAFRDQLELTEAYVGEGTAHLVYTVSEVYKTLHSNPKSLIKGDLLGNSTHQLRKIKSNKKYNNKEAVPLPSEVYDRFVNLIKNT